MGYEVLGRDTGGFHSSLCNGLGKDYEEKLHLVFNERGLFDDLDSAVQAAEYTRREEAGSEPGFRAPFRLTAVR